MPSHTFRGMKARLVIACKCNLLVVCWTLLSRHGWKAVEGGCFGGKQVSKNIYTTAGNPKVEVIIADPCDMEAKKKKIACLRRQTAQVEWGKGVGERGQRESSKKS